MRKQIQQALKKQFGELMARDAPEFADTKVKSRYVSAREIVFRHVDGDLHRYVVVVPKEDGEAFTVELAWSRLGRFPELGMRPSFAPAQVGDQRARDEGAVRLHELVDGKDTWWDAMPVNPLDPQSVMNFMMFQAQPLDDAKAGSLVEPLAQRAMRLVVEVGMPYLRGIA